MTHDQERIHVTAILWIVANETKLLPMFLFEGNPFKLVVKKSKAFFSKKKTFFLHIIKKGLKKMKILWRKKIIFWESTLILI